MDDEEKSDTNSVPSDKTALKEEANKNIESDDESINEFDEDNISLSEDEFFDIQIFDDVNKDIQEDIGDGDDLNTTANKNIEFDDESINEFDKDRISQLKDLLKKVYENIHFRYQEILEEKKIDDNNNKKQIDLKSLEENCKEILENVKGVSDVSGNEKIIKILEKFDGLIKKYDELDLEDFIKLKDVFSRFIANLVENRLEDRLIEEFEKIKVEIDDHIISKKEEGLKIDLVEIEKNFYKFHNDGPIVEIENDLIDELLNVEVIWNKIIPEEIRKGDSPSEEVIDFYYSKALELHGPILEWSEVQEVIASNENLQKLQDNMVNEIKELMDSKDTFLDGFEDLIDRVEKDLENLNNDQKKLFEDCRDFIDFWDNINLFSPGTFFLPDRKKDFESLIERLNDLYKNDDSSIDL